MAAVLGSKDTRWGRCTPGMQTQAREGGELENPNLSQIRRVATGTARTQREQQESPQGQRRDSGVGWFAGSAWKDITGVSQSTEKRLKKKVTAPLLLLSSGKKTMLFEMFLPL